MPRLFFEDFRPGPLGVYGPLPVSKDDIVAYGREFDPQPFHTDEEAAKESFVGALIASGWHTSCLNMRLIAEGFLNDADAMGAPGIDEVKWLRPVRPGDSLRTMASVLESRASRSRQDLGLVRFRFEVMNQSDEPVLAQTNWILFGRRHPGEPLAKRSDPATPKQNPEPPAQAAHASPQEAGSPPANPYLEDLVPGASEELGSFTFTAEDIVRFARQFDPQPFHLDPEAAKKSLFGALCASGWHTASAWMKLMVRRRMEQAARALGRGERPAQLGPSPGFKNLKWLKPVYAGDTITFRSAIVDTRTSTSRPGWGLAFHHNTGVDQNGEQVFAFDGVVFWERRPE
jgi:acyl dehydratase